MSAAVPDIIKLLSITLTASTFISPWTVTSLKSVAHYTIAPGHFVNSLTSEAPASVTMMTRQSQPASNGHFLYELCKLLIIQHIKIKHKIFIHFRQHKIVLLVWSLTSAMTIVLQHYCRNFTGCLLSNELILKLVFQHSRLLQ